MWGTKSSQGCRRRVCATDSAASAFAPRRRAGAAAAGRGGGRIITIRVGGGMGLVPLRLLLAVAAAAASIDDWAGRLAQPTCLEIPANLTLCRGIGYTRMRLPNLLEHDSMAEVQQQARSWVQLVNRRCHPDTQLFLCSLFSPVCLERPIFPCRSLCEAVRLGCEATMAHYGYPWPDMVRCDKFPLDNDMCIGVQSAAAGHSEDSASAACRACQQANTTESLVDNYCRADFVVRARVKRLQGSQLQCKRTRLLKLREGLPRRQLRRPVLKAPDFERCCGPLKGQVLLMGQRADNGSLAPLLIVPWRRTTAFRKALRLMRGVDCANPLEH
ncbi:secreted frizzled-related protein 5-like [Haemaphysalis longicornis]